MRRTTKADPEPHGISAEHHANNAATVRPSEAQRRYLERGLNQPGGKLPLFDLEGREVPRKTVEACITHGWAERWFDNPLKIDWLVCKLTPSGYRILGRRPPNEPMEPKRS